jgi:hypothetical protein
MDANTKGRPFGPWQCLEPVPWLFVDGEMPSSMLQERAEEMAIGENSKAPARLLSMNYALDMGLRRANLLESEWRESLSDILISGGYKVLVLDNISSLTPGAEENSKESWDEINQWALELRFRGVSTIFLHHAGKAGTQRGTSGREDNLDTCIVLKKPPDYEATEGCRFIVEFVKNRCAEGRHLLGEYEFAYSNGIWTHVSVKAKGREQVLRLLDGGQSQKDIAAELGLTKGRISQIRAEAIQRKWITPENKLTQSGFSELLCG